MSVLFGRISAHTSLLSLKISGYSLRPMPRLNGNPLRKNCKAHFGVQCSDDFGRGGRRLADASQGRQVQKGRTGPPKCDTCSTPVGLNYRTTCAALQEAAYTGMYKKSRRGPTMETNWADKLKNFDKVWQRVSRQRAADSRCHKPAMPKNRPQSRNTRFHGGRGGNFS